MSNKKIGHDIVITDKVTNKNKWFFGWDYRSAISEMNKWLSEQTDKNREVFFLHYTQSYNYIDNLGCWGGNSDIKNHTKQWTTLRELEQAFAKVA